MTVSELICGLQTETIQGDASRPVTGLAANDAQVTPGCAFVAIRGSKVDGHTFIPKAVEKGARTLIVEAIPPVVRSQESGVRSQNNTRDGNLLASDIVWVQVPDTRAAIPTLAANFYERPFEKMTVVGITGTNGKTSTAHLVQNLLETHGLPAARFGTIGHQIAGVTVEANNTTPDALELNELMSRALNAGAQAVSMEVSSHALVTHRVAEITFDAAVWTNLTQDHLDFHQTMDAYLEAKLRLFRQLKPGGIAVLNRDDDYYPPFEKEVRERSGVRLLSFGEHPASDVRAANIAATPTETAFTCLHGSLRLPLRLHLLGTFQVNNALAALGVGIGLGLTPSELQKGVESLKSVPGRFESVYGGQPFGVVVDYAHTPDALERLLKAARGLNPRQVIAVFGCGGDRDRTKRPKMGRITAELADVAIVTSDNPRTEDANAIIREIEAGMPSDKPHRTLPDREEAIAEALSLARDGDLVVIAGKGHEDYQIIGTTKKHFDDREIARKHLLEK